MPTNIVRVPVALVICMISSATFAGEEKTVVGNETLNATISALVEAHAEEAFTRADIGVHQVAAYWRDSDGDAAAFQAFCEDHFVPAGKDLEALLQRKAPMTTDEKDLYSYRWSGSSRRAKVRSDLNSQIDALREGVERARELQLDSLRRDLKQREDGLKQALLAMDEIDQSSS